MTNPVAVVRTEIKSMEDRTPIRQALHIGCPGCGGAHRIVVWQADGETGPVWEWDGNLDAPTVSPSILVRWTWGPERVERACHSFLRAGRWEYLSDCTHELAGQTADMTPVPEWLVPDVAD